MNLPTIICKDLLVLLSPPFCGSVDMSQIFLYLKENCFVSISIPPFKHYDSTSVPPPSLRGGVKIENRKNLGQCPNFNLGILKTPGGGGLNFSKMSELKIALRHHLK